MTEKACEGGRTFQAWHNMEECAACGTRIRHELVDHPFFGFHNCPDKRRTADAWCKQPDPFDRLIKKRRLSLEEPPPINAVDPVDGIVAPGERA
jgi:hypothetical protein